MVLLAIVLTLVLIGSGVLAVFGVIIMHPGGYLFLWGALGWVLCLAFVFAWANDPPRAERPSASEGSPAAQRRPHAAGQLNQG